MRFQDIFVVEAVFAPTASVLKLFAGRRSGNGRRRSNGREPGCVAAPLAALAALAFAAVAQAQTPAVCSNTLAAGERILCSEEAASTDDIGIDASGLAIETTADLEPGIGAFRAGEGDIRIEARSGAITTGGQLSDGILASHKGGAGDVVLRLSFMDIRTNRAGADAVAHGMVGETTAAGRLAAVVTGGSIATLGDVSYGIFLNHAYAGSGAAGAIALDIGGGLAIETSGDNAYGIYALRQSDGDIRLTLRDAAIDTAGAWSIGVYALLSNNPIPDIAGDVRIDLLGGVRIATEGANATGIVADARGNDPAVRGDIMVTARGGNSIETGGDDAHGVAALITDGRAGDVLVDLRGLSVTTGGKDAHGIFSLHDGPGDIDIRVSGGSVTTRGMGAYGIFAGNLGTTGAIVIDVGGSVRAGGADAHGIAAGELDDDGAVSGASPLGADGYRRQTVRVNGRVQGGTGISAGVFMAGGGRVFIGPRGRVGALSGVAIRAVGNTVVDGETVPRRLWVELMPDGRSPAGLLDGTVVNDGGETVLAVNGTPLYDSEEGGRTGLWAPNGARDVTLIEGFSGLDISSADSFIDRYAPRAAVYEALPGFLLRLDGGRPSGTRIARPGSPAWARVSGGRGSYEPGRASVGAAYDFRRFSAEAGLDVALGGNVTGSFSLRHVQGSAEVDSPHGGGEIEAEGLGAAASLSWSGADGYYARGRLAFTNYEIDVSSRDRGSLARDVEARGYSLGTEAGRRFAVGETVTLTPRAWAARRWLSGGAFTDAVGARVSLDETTRYTGGIGLSAETARTLEDGTLALRASADVERALGGADTAARVSGVRLESEASATRVLLGLGGTWRKGRFSLGARLAAGGPGSGDTEYSGRVSLGWTF